MSSLSQESQESPDDEDDESFQGSQAPQDVEVIANLMTTVFAPTEDLIGKWKRLAHQLYDKCFSSRDLNKSMMKQVSKKMRFAKLGKKHQSPCICGGDGCVQAKAWQKFGRTFRHGWYSVVERLTRVINLSLPGCNVLMSSWKKKLMRNRP